MKRQKAGLMESGDRLTVVTFTKKNLTMGILKFGKCIILKGLIKKALLIIYRSCFGSPLPFPFTQLFLSFPCFLSPPLLSSCQCSLNESTEMF